MPAVLNGGLLDTLDLWGGMIAGLVYISLLRLYPELDGVSNSLRAIVPAELHALGADSGKTAVTTNETARAIAVLVYGSLLCARVITRAVLYRQPTVAEKSKKRVQSKDSKVIKEKQDGEVHVQVTQTPVKERKATPRKSPKPKK